MREMQHTILVWLTFLGTHSKIRFYYLVSAPENIQYLTTILTLKDY